MGASPTFEAIRDELAAVESLQPTGDQLFVYIIWDFQGPPKGGVKRVWIQKTRGDAFTHEVGHAIGFGGHAEDSKDIMYAGTTTGKRVRKWHADIVNP